MGLEVTVALAVALAVEVAVEFEEESAAEEDSAVTEMLGEHQPVGMLDPSLFDRTAFAEEPQPGLSGRTQVESRGWESTRSEERLDPGLCQNRTW